MVLYFSTQTSSFSKSRSIAKMIQQLAHIQKGKLEGFLLTSDPNRVERIELKLNGPKATPFENGTFLLQLIIPDNFPQVAPKGFFLTKIFHPNISTEGEICVNILKRDWDPLNWSLIKILQVSVLN